MAAVHGGSSRFPLPVGASHLCTSDLMDLIPCAANHNFVSGKDLFVFGKELMLTCLILVDIPINYQTNSCRYRD